MESVASLAWNGWQLSYGISGNFRVEYAHIAGHERQSVDQRCPCHEGITEGHLPLLPESNRLIKDGLRERQDLREAKERFQILPLLVLELVIPEHFHVTDGRDRRRMRGHELSQVR